ncbi:MAG TPA: membrane protein insertion efficiency factor YidD [Candidatus Angelobacter sp.]|jgi:hypothetical protein|nr:membrane protein insertion efficiency factor YidD [Candidatus Angelobacter sp.]
MKQAVISLVHLYQRVAPDRVRNSCRFEPSCSNFAVMAIEKYGVVVGFVKTLDRLRRCRPPHGGFDVP